MRKWLPQLGFIWLPFLVVVIYYTAIASDRYVSEAKFILQQTNGEQPISLDLGSLISGGGSSTRQDDLLVQAYIHSMDMLNNLEKTLHLRAHYSDSRWDIISRLPKDASQEDFLEYYRDHIRVSFDETSSVLTIEVESFDRAYSQKIARYLLEKGEAFVNSIGHHMAEEQMAFVARETERAQTQLRTAKRDVISFQDSNELFSPRGETDSRVGIIGSLEAELAKSRAELKKLLGFLNTSAPEVVAERNQINALEKQIQAEKARLSGHQGGKLNDLVARFEDIQMDLDFATDLYRSSLTALEAARVEASRKLKHLVVIQSPLLPDEALYPRRLYMLTTVWVFLALLYGIGRLTVATIKDHSD